jgi:putative ABC transport system permease protein
MKSLRAWLNRLTGIFSNQRREQEFAAELEGHLQLHIDENVRSGMTPDAARRDAILKLGGLEPTRQAYRERGTLPFLETILHDARYSVRGFRRNPVFTLTIVATLMLGIGATTAVFSVVDRILFRSLPYADADRLVSLGLVHSLETQEFMTGRFYYDWRGAQKAFGSMTAENAVTGECDLTERNPAQLSCPYVEASFLPTLGISPVLGRNFLPEETRPGGPNVALISYGLWLTHYNLDPGILNKTINIDGSPVRVVGVLPKEFEMPRLQAADVLLPIAVNEAEDRTANGGIGSPRRVFARLNPGVSVQQAEAELQPLFQQTLSQIPSDIRHDFHLKVRSLRDRQMQDVSLTAWVLLGAVLTVLLIACANVASLLMARGAMRQRELAVRSALGASRSRLARQALTESLLLSLMGAIAGCALAEGLLRLFIAIAPTSIPYLSKIHLDLRIICFTVVLAILSGVLFGLAPALQKPSDAMLSGRTLTSTPHATMRQWLVVAQIAASMVLLTGATLLLRSFRNLEDQNLGMSTDNTLTASITLGEHSYPTPQSKLNFYQQLTTRLRFGPGITLVSVSDTIPPGGGGLGGRFEEIAVAGRPLFTPGTGGVVASRLVSPEYFRALNIPMVQGKGFREEDMTASQRVIVLSKRLASLLFPDQNPIGQRLRFDRLMSTEAWSTVVGVAADVKNSGLTKEEVPEYYRLRRNLPGDWECCGTWGRTSVIVVRSSLPPDQTSRWIRTQVATLDPTLPVDIATLHQRVSKLADQPRFQALLIGFFAATGFALAIIGLYGVIAYSVSQRTREIGVRMALGAQRASVYQLVLKEGARLAVWGIAAGIACSLAATLLLRSILFGVQSWDVATLATVAIVLAAASLLASYVPAHRAASINPVEALRAE